MSIKSLPKYSVPAKCLFARAESRVRTGLSGLELSMAIIVLCSASLASKLVGAITICSPTYQSTASFKVS
jgi:hypothetical protein